MTYHAPKGAEKQLDYILTDKKHHSWSRDAETNDTIHMGSDHKGVMAKFEIQKGKAKGKPRQNKAPTAEQQREMCDDENQQQYLFLEQEVKEAESGKAQRMQQERRQKQVRKQ